MEPAGPDWEATNRREGGRNAGRKREGSSSTDGYLAELAPNGVEVGVGGAFEQEAQLRSDISADGDHLAGGESSEAGAGAGSARARGVWGGRTVGPSEFL